MTLPLGSALLSADGRFRCEMQLDGNFVLYGPHGKAAWSTNTHGKKIRYEHPVVLRDLKIKDSQLSFTEPLAFPCRPIPHRGQCPE